MEKHKEDGHQEENYQEENQIPEAVTPEVARKKWFGRGIYGSKDVPIRLLDGLIATFIIAIVAMVFYFTMNGGYTVTFHTFGGSEVASQKHRYGELAAEPYVPIKPGYQFEYWYQEEEPNMIWNFSVNKIGGDLTLYAHWVPAKILVKFDLNGGTTTEGMEVLEPKEVVFNETYGELPTPVKERATFSGWEYSGAIITADSTVWMTGEHVLKAVWNE
ncbi:MAG TPA: hypothetical protein DHW61_10835 [Lachnoclostridium phytofermentans]|uniref:Uncharacterized protein n=1 Tax=Lachnoclostridium phytofermentans TaxID=66219 RepID=A0A3D2X821_9FIRM|nr:InlB B-repeat-containing protein [Lachnoclostridium sp.]HCL02887.1 hypothetical protein [Lachnoclostridium phytofermentans]